MYDEIKVNSFLQRLSSLQKLCSYSDPNFPVSLLFVCGQDGRQNKGSLSIIKYLFFGAVGKDLLEGTLDLEYEALEDLVLLVQQNSVSVVWTHAMKKLIGPQLEKYPNLVEYLSTREEEEVMDLIQNRKCVDFKRMMLESSSRGGGVGIQIPIGYDEILDVESWPMLQAFALDDVVVSTGFFTSYYSVVDITEFTDILFRTVDSYCVDKAVTVMHQNVLPHCVQFLKMLDGDTAEQRAAVVADDCVGPLAMLFEFSELECAQPVDPTLRPVVLFGNDSEWLGDMQGTRRTGWSTTKAGAAPHVVVEACEPAAGIRWCRTYFLQRGKSVPYLVDPDELVSSAVDSTDSFVAAENLTDGQFAVTNPLLWRMETLYVTLWRGLRANVREAFATNSDVLEAGTVLQERMDALFKGSASLLNVHSDLGWPTHDFKLLHHERLQVHMDCINSLGQIISIEDVDDLGGACWTYIRVSVHGVKLPNGGEGTIAVGDTFLFSPSTSLSLQFPHLHSGSNTPASYRDRTLFPLVGDHFCITHPIPYWHSLPGSGREDVASHRMLSCVRHPHMATALGLGKAMDDFGTGLLSIPILTDHPFLPLVFSHIRPFAGGFVVEKLNGASTLPMIVTIETHVKNMWTLNLADVEAYSSGLLEDRLDGAPEFGSQDGVMIVFELKQYADFAAVDAESKISETNRTKSKSTGGDNDDEIGEHEDDYEDSKHDTVIDESERLKQSIRYNPLQRTFPEVAKSIKYLAMYLPSESRAMNALAAARSEWRNAARMFDVQDIRGFPSRKDQPRVPNALLRAYLTCIDTFSFGIRSAIESADPIKSSHAFGTQPIGLELAVDSTNSYEISQATVLALTHASNSDKNCILTTIGTGFLPIRAVHSVSEAQRLHAAQSTAPRVTLRDSTNAANGQRLLVPVIGVAGSGALTIAQQLFLRLSQSFPTSSYTVHFNVLDLVQVSIEVAKANRSNPARLADANIDATRDEGERFVEEIRLLLDRYSAQPSARLSGSGSVPVNVTVVLVLVSAIHSLQQYDICNLLQNSYRASIVSILSVVTAETASPTEPYRPSGNSDSIGGELWRISSRQLMAAGLCDTAILVDNPSAPVGGSAQAVTAFASVRSWLALAQGTNTQPETVVLKLSPSMLRLDDSTFDDLKAAIARYRDQPAMASGINFRSTSIVRNGLIPRHFDATANSASSSIPVCVRVSGSMNGTSGASAIVLEPVASEPGLAGWDIPNLLSALQILFPAASQSGVNILQNQSGFPSDSASTSSRWMDRLLHLCKIKVMRSRQENESKSTFEAEVRELLRTRGKQVDSLHVHSWSIHGVVPLFSARGETSVVGWVCVEANSSSIILREIREKVLLDHIERHQFATVDSSSKFASQGLLIAQGSFIPQECDVLKTLFSKCGRYKLKRMPLLGPDDIAHGDKLHIQRNLQSIFQSKPVGKRESSGVENFDFELPGGWYFDGSRFVHITGKSEMFRPDIEEWVGRWIELQNARKQKYNEILTEVEAYL